MDVQHALHSVFSSSSTRACTVSSSSSFFFLAVYPRYYRIFTCRHDFRRVMTSRESPSVNRSNVNLAEISFLTQINVASGGDYRFSRQNDETSTPHCCLLRVEKCSSALIACGVGKGGKLVYALLGAAVMNDNETWFLNYYYYYYYYETEVCVNCMTWNLLQVRYSGFNLELDVSPAEASIMSHVLYNSSEKNSKI